MAQLLYKLLTEPDDCCFCGKKIPAGEVVYGAEVGEKWRSICAECRKGVATTVATPRHKQYKCRRCGEIYSMEGRMNPQCPNCFAPLDESDDVVGKES